ncbi:Os09g0551100, partial [Oryza sativa Japonica Group]
HPRQRQETIPATARRRLLPPATPREPAGAPLPAACRLEAVEALARGGGARRDVAVAVRPAVAVRGAVVRRERAEGDPLRRALVPAQELELAGAGHHVPRRRGAVGDPELHVDLIVVVHHVEVDGRAGGGEVLAGGEVARPHGGAPVRPGPVPHDELERRLRVHAVREAPRRGVAAGVLPGHKARATPRPFVQLDLHLRYERVGRVVEALPQDGAVRPDDEVAIVEELGHRRRGRAPSRDAGGDIGRPKNAAVGVGQDEVGVVGQRKPRGDGPAGGDRRSFPVGHPHHGAVGDVVPYADVLPLRCGIGRREEA